MPDYSARLRAAQQRMVDQGVDLLFLPRSTNLHYLTGIPREEPNFGNTIYPGEWLSGAWITPDRPPILTVPRMLAEFHWIPRTARRAMTCASCPTPATRWGWR